MFYFCSLISASWFSGESPHSPVPHQGSLMLARTEQPDPELLGFVSSRSFTTVLADPPWQFTNRTGKVAPEHRRLSRYPTLTLDEIAGLPVSKITTSTAHLYLWIPNALLPEGLAVMRAGLHLQVQHCLAQGA
jgi:MT-A70